MVLPGVTVCGDHQWGTYRRRAESKARLLAWPSEVPIRTWRRTPSGVRHCTCPLVRDTNRSLSPLGGGGGGGVLATVTVTAAEVPVFPAASRATAVRAWEPLVAVV